MISILISFIIISYLAVSLLGEIISMPKYDDEYVEKSKENIRKEMEVNIKFIFMSS